MEGLMNFGCFLAGEERSEGDFSGGMAMRAGSSVLRVVSGPAVLPARVRLAVPYYFWRTGSHQLAARHFPAPVFQVTSQLVRYRGPVESYIPR